MAHGKKSSDAAPAQTSGRPAPAELIAAYPELIQFLRETRDQFSKAEDKLPACIDALVAIRRFFEVDRAVFKEGVMEPIGTIMAALLDVTNGASPPLFASSKRSEKGRPKDASRNAALAAVAGACAELLHRCGIPLGDACKHVVRELGKAKFTHTTYKKAITPITIKHWRAEMKVGNSNQKTAIFNQVLSGYEKAYTSGANEKITLNFMRECVEGLKSDGAATVPPKI